MAKPSIVERFMNRLGYAKQGRSYDAGRHDRLTSDWAIRILSADAEIRRSLKTMVAHSREQAQNNDYIKKYLRLFKTNVIGHNGIRLKMNVKDPNGDPDKPANSIIEAAWVQWCRKENASVCGTLSFRDLQCLALETAARDGGILFQKVKNFDNPFRFALNPIEIDHLDENLNKRLPNGNVVRMGIEINQWARPIAYWLLKNHPGDLFETLSQSQRYTRVPADQIIHLYMPERTRQLREVPWSHTAMTRFNMLKGYEEAELVAARVSSCKMGFYEEDVTDGGKFIGDGKTSDGDLVADAEPGTFQKLAGGLKFKPFDPQHPTSQVGDFIKSMLRGAASGLGVSYNSLASDLEGVNYSSLRQGALEDRDYYKFLQAFMGEHFCDDTFSAWLDVQFLTGKIDPLPPAKFDKFNKPTWRSRGWPWVDPLKESKANETALKNGTTTREKIIAQEGGEWQDNFEQLKLEQDKAKKLGLVFEMADPTQPMVIQDGTQN